MVKDFIVVTTGRIKKLYKLLPPLLMRDIKERYAGSVMGVFWTFLQPLLFILIYWMVFSRILNVRIKADTGEIPFIAYLLSGLLPWLALQEGVLRGASSILEKRYIIKKVIFPAELFPLSSVLSSLIHYSLGIFFFLIFYFIWKGNFSLSIVPLTASLLMLQIFLTSGLALLFSSVAVYLRDVVQILGVTFQVLFYMSTVLYPIDAVPAGLREIILLNPFTTLTEAYHKVILYGGFPEMNELIYLVAVTSIVFFSGVCLFRKLKGGFADVL